jgi:hypothetical protein
MKDEEIFTKICIVLVLLASIFNGPTVSVMVSSRQYFAHFRSSPLVFITYPVLLYFIIKVATQKLDLEGATNMVCGVRRQFGALIIDLFSYSLVPITPLSFLFLYFEFRANGKWNWDISRNYPMPEDRYVVFATILSMCAVMISMAIPIWKRRQTMGEYVMGIVSTGQVVGPIEAIFRIILGAFVLFTWPVSVFLAYRDEKKQFWHQKIFKVYAVKYKPIGNLGATAA